MISAMATLKLLQKAAPTMVSVSLSTRRNVLISGYDDFSISVIPEPSTSGLACFATVALIRSRRLAG